jgi:NIMA (never in mitosis gene a)-related kinase
VIVCSKLLKCNVKYIVIDQIVKQVGKGSFGKVFLVQHKGKRRFYVLKSIPMTDQKETETAIKEVKMLQMFNSPFIVKYHESFKEKNFLYIIMEYCDDGDLNGYFQYCKQKGARIPEEVCFIPFYFHNVLYI